MGEELSYNFDPHPMSLCVSGCGISRNRMSANEIYRCLLVNAITLRRRGAGIISQQWRTPYPIYYMGKRYIYINILFYNYLLTPADMLAITCIHLSCMLWNACAVVTFHPTPPYPTTLTWFIIFLVNLPKMWSTKPVWNKYFYRSIH